MERKVDQLNYVTECLEMKHRNIYDQKLFKVNVTQSFDHRNENIVKSKAQKNGVTYITVTRKEIVMIYGPFL